MCYIMILFQNVMSTTAIINHSYIMVGKRSYCFGVIVYSIAVGLLKSKKIIETKPVSICLLLGTIKLINTTGSMTTLQSWSPGGLK